MATNTNRKLYQKPNIVYISGTEQFSKLKNPRKPLDSEASDEVLDAAFYRETLKLLMPPVVPGEGPLAPLKDSPSLYGVTPEDVDKLLFPEIIGVCPTIEYLWNDIHSELPSISNTMDAIVVHSDYYIELRRNSLRNPQQVPNVLRIMADIMVETPIFVLEEPSDANEHSQLYAINTAVKNMLYNEGLPYTTYNIEMTRMVPGNPEAPWESVPESYIAMQFYEMLQLFLANPPSYADPVLAFRGILESRTNPDLAAIQDEINPDETHIDGSPYLGRVITVTSKKGGTGKTTTSLGIAHALTTWGKEAEAYEYAKHALKVIIVDLDLQDGQVGFNTSDQSKTVVGIFNELYEATMNGEHRALGEDKEKDWRIIEKYIVQNERVGYDTLLAPEDPRDLNDLDPNFYRAIISILREHYDVVIIDTSVQLADPYMTLCAYPLTHKLFYVAEPYPIPLDTMKRQFTYGLGSVKRGGGGMNPRRIRIFVNKIEPDHIVKKGSALGFWQVADYSINGIPVLTGVPYLHEAALDAVNVSLPGGFNYLLNNKGYSEGMSILAYDIVRGTGYNLFSPETTKELEDYFSMSNL
jgi:CobQ/CobB/MinD/ParA nucleotide binding domain protein